MQKDVKILLWVEVVVLKIGSENRYENRIVVDYRASLCRRDLIS